MSIRTCDSLGQLFNFAGYLLLKREIEGDMFAECVCGVSVVKAVF